MIEKDPIPAVSESAGTETNVAPDQKVAEASAEPIDTPLTRRQKFRLVGLVILKRVRFIAILAGVGMFIGYWDTVMNYWEKWTQPQSVAAHALEPGHEFYCPMDPQVIRSTYEPNGDVPKCPICGMPLSVRKQGEAAKLPEGITGRVQLTPERIQLAGIKTVPVEYRPVAKQTKTVGYVTYDEGRLSRVVSRVDGYVEKLYVDKTFTMVHKGDPLAEIYSPELFGAVQELVLAKSPGGADEFRGMIRNKLLLLGVSSEDIDAMAASGKASPRLIIRSPQTGYVIEKKIVAGSSIEAKMTLLEVADLSKVWIEADIYEKDIAFLQPGQSIEATVEAFPNSAFTGKLALVYPKLDTATRTNRVRFELDNPQYELRPGMFATVRINTPLESIEPYKTLAANQKRIILTASGDGSSSSGHEFLVVPERAVIDSGNKKVVYVQREPGMFEGVEVELGPRNGGYYPVLAGLEPGDMVAAAGGFLIDAETRLNPAAASTYFGASGSPQAGVRSSAPSSTSMRQSIPAAADQEESNIRPQAVVAADNATDHASHGARRGFMPEELKNIEQLPEADRRLALKQRLCPITGAALGSMGIPVKITLRGQPVLLCCKGCVGKAKRNPEETLKSIKEFEASTGDNALLNTRTTSSME